MRHAWLACLAIALAAALAGCSGGEVPLAAHPLALGARSADFPRAPTRSLPATGQEATFADRCGIEAVRGATVSVEQPDGIFVADLPATAWGWAYPPDEAPGLPDAWLRWLPVGGGTAAEFPLVLHYGRPDVVAARASDLAAYAGFTNVTVDGLAPGTYDVQVVFASAQGRWACSNARRVVLQ